MANSNVADAVNSCGISPESVDAFLGTDTSTWVQPGEEPAGVAQALVAELRAAEGATETETVESLAQVLDALRPEGAVVMLKIYQTPEAWPNAGDYVSDGSDLYRLTATESSVHTHDEGGNVSLPGHYIYAEGTPADWDECDDDEKYCVCETKEVVPR